MPMVRTRRASAKHGCSPTRRAGTRGPTARRLTPKLAALRLHYGEAVAIVEAQRNAIATSGEAAPKVTISGADRVRSTDKLTDGRLSNEIAFQIGAKPTIEIAYASPRAMDRIVVVEDEQNIKKYELAVETGNGNWIVVSTNDGAGEPLFPHCVFRPKPATPDVGGSLPNGSSPKWTVRKIRLRVLDATGSVQLVEIAGSYAPGTKKYQTLWWKTGAHEALVPKGPPVIDLRIKGDLLIPVLR